MSLTNKKFDCDCDTTRPMTIGEARIAKELQYFLNEPDDSEKNRKKIRRKAKVSA